MPSLSRPMALSMPDGGLDGARRRVAGAGRRVTVLGMMPPSWAKSTTPAISRA